MIPVYKYYLCNAYVAIARKLVIFSQNNVSARIRAYPAGPC